MKQFLRSKLFCTLFAGGLSLYATGISAVVNINDLDINHCSSCGPVLLGAAKLNLDSIRWNGSQRLDILAARTTARAFGFTGDSQYLSEEERDANTWLFSTEQAYSMSRAEGFGVSPPLSFFFAPERAGELGGQAQYEGQIQALIGLPPATTPTTGGQPTLIDPTQPAVGGNDVGTRVVTVSGQGIEDSDVMPALVLEVNVENVAMRQPCLDGQGQCEEMQPSDPTLPVVFNITPRLIAGRVPAGVEPIEHAYVQLLVDETDTPCSPSNITFRDQGLTQNSFVANDYFHFLEPSGPSQTPEACLRVYNFIVSVGKTFRFQTRNRRDTGTSAADYHFSLRGHIDRNNGNRWPGSQPRFRLATSAQGVVNPEPIPGTPPPELSGLSEIVPGAGPLAGTRFNGGVQISPTTFLDNEGVVSPGQSIDLITQFAVPAAHVGQSAELILVLNSTSIAGNGFLMKNAFGIFILLAVGW